MGVMNPRHAQPHAEPGPADAPAGGPAEKDDRTGPHGPGSTIGERITGERDPQDVDGLLTLDDLTDPTGDVSDLRNLLPRATQYGDPVDP